MSNQTGLKDRARFEAFSQEWRDVALKEAEKWCADEKARQLLADAVLAEFQKKYADSAPPLSMDYQIRAQVCLVYSLTGENTRKLENYIAEHALPETPAEPFAAARPMPRPEPSAPAAENVSAAAPEAPAPAPTSVIPIAEPVPAPPAEPAPAAPPKVKADAPQEKPTAPAVEVKAAEQKPKARPDTFLDPVRTSYWTPNEERTGHVIAEVELPDDEEEERSPIISFINLVLFLLTIGAFGFCFYETGFLQYLLQ